MVSFSNVLDWRPTPATKQEPQNYIDPQLLRSDLLVLESLLQDIDDAKPKKKLSVEDLGYVSQSSSEESAQTNRRTVGCDPNGAMRLPDAPTTRKALADTQADVTSPRDEKAIGQMRAWNNPDDKEFGPSVFVTWDLPNINLPFGLNQRLLYPYMRWAKTVARNPTDIVMVTHLIMYFTTSIPSAITLFLHFNYFHGILHVMMQTWFAGTYTLMMHQHIHMKGILAKKYAWFDHAFPYITDPLHGHTWNSYYHHHVKHHHIEGNGPDDLSSTIRYQRDDFWHFLHYFARFFFLVWLDLPVYFIRKKKANLAIKTTMYELGNYSVLYVLGKYVNFRATLFVFLLPLLIMRIGLMIGNWGQHAFVDEVEPDSDFRSSITLIDVASNRFSYNDGYHTSHHLNPRRHWRDHPVSFLQQKHTYAKESALVFRNIDYLMITISLLSKNYIHLAKCLVPIGSQIGMTIPELAALLETKTRRFTEEEIQKKFNSKNPSRYLEKL